MFAQTIVEAPKNGAISRAAAISAPRLAEPTTNTRTKRNGAPMFRFEVSPTKCKRMSPYCYLYGHARSGSHHSLRSAAMTVLRLRAELRSPRRRVALLVAVFVLGGAVAYHHVEPSGMDGMVAGAVCLAVIGGGTASSSPRCCPGGGPLFGPCLLPGPALSPGSTRRRPAPLEPVPYICSSRFSDVETRRRRNSWRTPGWRRIALSLRLKENKT